MSAIAQQPSQPLSTLRISALSFALLTHAAALALMAVPQQPLPAPPPATPLVAVPIEFIPQRQPPAPVPPVPRPPTRSIPRAVTPPPVVAPVVPAESAFTVPAMSSQVATSTDERSAAPAPIGRAAQIAYDDATPPAYPPLARRRGWEGTVMLRILVGIDGRPVEVEVAQSSGHGLLDRSARDHVLRRWRFQPALQNGEAIRGWATVPVTFTLAAG